MITAPNESVILSALGWSDAGSVWRYHPASHTTDTVKLSDAEWLRLIPGSGDTFTVVHNFREMDRIDITAHTFASFPTALATARIEGRTATFSGNQNAWQSAATNYTANLDGSTYLITLNPNSETATLFALDWYSNERYDLGYQGIVGVTAIPNTRRLLFSIQRSSNLVLYDCDRHIMVREVPLSGRGGNPTLEFRGDELWATDYDTLLRLDISDWRIIKSRRLQSSPNGTMEFIGDFAFDVSGETCVVARPFTGDVVAIDKRTLKPKMSFKTDRQPLEVGVLSSGFVVARDWKTGDLLKGQLSRGFWGA